MTRRSVIALSAGLAAACGFGLARLFPGGSRNEISSAAEAKPASASRAADRARTSPGFGSSDDWRTTEGKLLAVIRSGSKDDLMAILFTILDGDRTPSIPRELRVETLARRIVQLGGAEELLALAGLCAADREQITAATIRMLAETEPVAAERMVAAMPENSGRVLATQALLETLAVKAPERGLALLKADKSSRQGDSQFFSAWAKKDPKSAAEAALALQKEYAGFGLNSALGQWTRDDSSAAIQWSEQLQGGQRSAALRSCIFELGAVDPVAAGMYLIEHPGVDSSGVAHDMLNGLEGDPWHMAEEVLAKVPPGDVRTEMLNSIAQALAADPAQALDWAATLLPGEREGAIQSIFNKAGQSQPEEVFRLALDRLKGETRRTALSAMLGNWAGADFDAAFQAATENLDAAELKSVLPTLFRGSQFLFSDPARSLRMLSKVDPQLRSDVLKNLGKRMGPSLYRSDVHMALDPADRDALLEGSLGGFSTKPALLREILAALPEERKWAHVETITGALAYDDPQRAAEFALSVTGHDKEKRLALEALASNWAYTDPVAAEAFLHRLPPGDIRKAVARKLAEKFRTFDPDAAKRVEAQSATP